MPTHPPSCSARCHSRSVAASSGVAATSRAGGGCDANQERSSSRNDGSSEDTTALGAAGRPGHGLELGVLEQPVVAVLASDAGLLVAAERTPQVGTTAATVDAHGARLDLLRDLKGPDRIRVPHG